MIDSHAHLGALDPATLHPVLMRAVSAGVSAIINIATDEQTISHGQKLLIELHNKATPAIFLAAATTPHDVAKDGETFFPIVKQAVEKKTLIAIGETGLDYHYLHSPKETQILYLQKYLDLAHWAQLPVIIHCRDAFQDLFSITDAREFKVPMLIHCFTGTMEEAQEVISRGWYLSLSGIVTFPKSTVLQEVAAKIPLNRLLIETDSPFLAPVPYRGKTNEPAYVLEVAKMIAKIRSTSLETIIQHTSANTKRFFHVP